MTSWILAALALFVLQTLLAPSLRYLGAGWREQLWIALGPRDREPDMPVLGARAARALNNLSEAMPVFVTLALLHVTRGPAPLAVSGAALFVAARIVYVPAYLSGVPGLRSTAWVISWIGLSAMFATLP